MSSSQTKKPSILLGDDTPGNLEILVQFFDKQGFEVFVATDGTSALEQVPSTHPDLILLDAMMPGLDGFETCQRLKANPDTADIPVIFMTALTETADKVKGFRAGAVDYVTKPIQHEQDYEPCDQPNPKLLLRLHLTVSLHKATRMGLLCSTHSCLELF